MSRVRQYIEFEGLFSESVLGIFRIIRGFANLRDLAAVSVPYKMEDGEQCFRVVGHQWIESAKHGLHLLLGQDPEHAMTPDNEFAYNPALHLTTSKRATH